MTSFNVLSTGQKGTGKLSWLGFIMMAVTKAPKFTSRAQL